MTLGRPRTITDEAILAALARAISRVGPARLTLADVAAEAGIAAPTIAQRFGSKRHLLLAFAAQAPGHLLESFTSARASLRAPASTSMITGSVTAIGPSAAMSRAAWPRTLPPGTAPRSASYPVRSAAAPAGGRNGSRMNSSSWRSREASRPSRKIAQVISVPL